MDPLSDVLSLVKIRHYSSGGLKTGGNWCIEFPRYESVRFYAVISGECWMSVEGVPEQIRLHPGDCLLFPNGHPFRVGSDMALAPADACTIFPEVSDGEITSYNGGGDFLTICGHFTMDGDHAGVLLGLLPPFFHIREESDKAVLRWTLDRMRQEMFDPQPGGFLVGQQLATMVLVQALRLYLAEIANGSVGWLFALADKRMGAAISAMHKDPARRWTLESLATHAGMSRTAFAVKFKETVGKSPLDYLTHWRMLLAADRFANSREPISVVAPSLGYESESAFSTAFKRVMGCSPRQYGRRGNLPSSCHSESEAARANRLERGGSSEHPMLLQGAESPRPTSQ